MNAFRTIRTALVLCTLSVLALSSTATSAKAGYPYTGLYGCRDRAVYGNTLQFYPTTTFYSTRFRTTVFVPTYNVYPTQFSYPVTVYDSFGRPHVVYQSNYSALLR
jgi:hypothetical protein